MDSRPDRPVNSRASHPQEKLPPRVTNNKRLLKVSSSAAAELTPLSRLKKFKEVRDRNLAKASSLPLSKRTNLVPRGNMIGLEQNDGPSNTNGVAHTNGKPQVKMGPAKAKVSPKNPKEQNGVDAPQNGTEHPPSDQPTTNGSSVGTNGTDSSPLNGEGAAAAPQPKEAKGNEVVEIEVEEISGSEGEATNERDSEGSSLEVVIDESSSAESLDLNVTAASEPDDFQSPAVEVSANAASNVEEPFVPDFVKRLEAGGSISSRPTLRGKRSAGVLGTESDAKRARTDSVASSLSTSWQFFSPKSVLKKVWTRQGDVPPKPEDDSMIVNVSNVEEPKTGKWCRIM